MEKVGDSFGRFVDVKGARSNLGLGWFSDRAAAGVAVMARVRGGADFVVVVDIDWLVANPTAIKRGTFPDSRRRHPSASALCII